MTGSNLNLGHAHLLTYGPLLRLCKSNAKHAYSMYITSTCIHLDPWKSFMKFGIKKSHEMMSYILAWIALVSEGNYRPSTKPYNLAQMTLIELHNKSHEGFVLGGGQENTSIGLKLGFKLYRDATLTGVDQSLIVLAWSYTLHQSWSLSRVEQTLFLDQEPNQLGTKSNWGSQIESATIFRQIF